MILTQLGTTVLFSMMAFFYTIVAIRCFICKIYILGSIHLTGGVFMAILAYSLTLELMEPFSGQAFAEVVLIYVAIQLVLLAFKSPPEFIKALTRK